MSNRFRYFNSSPEIIRLVVDRANRTDATKIVSERKPNPPEHERLLGRSP